LGLSFRKNQMIMLLYSCFAALNIQCVRIPWIALAQDIWLRWGRPSFVISDQILDKELSCTVGRPNLIKIKWYKVSSCYLYEKYHDVWYFSYTL
jgi:hypothetical protein